MPDGPRGPELVEPLLRYLLEGSPRLFWRRRGFSPLLPSSSVGIDALRELELRLVSPSPGLLQSDQRLNTKSEAVSLPL